MRNFIEWLEGDISRTRKVLAIGIFITWEVTVMATIWLYAYTVDIKAVLGVVTAQLATVLAFYMFTSPKKS